MKTAISVPDEIFHEAERLARRAKRSRSELYSLALREYVARHAPERVTELMNETLTRVGEQSDRFTSLAAGRVLRRSDW
jgi:metal-responsive CopG/Arc/MetJ family transcriptional regulator